jgi:cell division protein FtsL
LLYVNSSPIYQDIVKGQGINKMTGTKEPWKIDKTINIPTIITAIMLISGIIMWYSAINSHFQRHDDQIQQLQEQQKDAKQEMNNRFDRIDDKLDKLTQKLIR